jgi:molecular chaperone GrpE
MKTDEANSKEQNNNQSADTSSLQNQQAEKINNTEPKKNIIEIAVEEFDVLQKSKEEKDKYMDLYMRANAELVNSRNRMKKEKEDWLTYANEKLIVSLLPALDVLVNTVNRLENDLEKINDTRVEQKADSEFNVKGHLQIFLDSLKMAEKEFFRILGQQGLKKIESLNQKFDVSLHEIVDVISNKELPECVIVDEIEPGYILHNRTVKPAKVKVNKQS